MRRAHRSGMRRDRHREDDVPATVDLLVYILWAAVLLVLFRYG